jgi:hypothetical protein
MISGILVGPIIIRPAYVTIQMDLSETIRKGN